MSQSTTLATWDDPVTRLSVHSPADWSEIGSVGRRGANTPITVGAMVAHPAVRAVSFTGSTPVGRQLIRQAADRILRTAPELGGEAPFVVFDDADVAEESLETKFVTVGV